MTVQAPEGSILNCRYPASVAQRTSTGWHCAPALFGALASVLPDRVQAFTGLPIGVGAYGYDSNGQLLTASFMDYAMPRAADLPMFQTAISEVPSTTHPLGLRGGGEGGITPALGVIANAIVDGLREFGVTHVELPATPARIWRAIQTARTA